MKFFTINPNLIIQALVNTDDYDNVLQVPTGTYLVKVVDKDINTTTVFHMDQQGKPFRDFEKKPVIRSIEMWEKYSTNEETMTQYKGESMYQALLEECQTCYEEISAEKEHGKGSPTVMDLLKVQQIVLDVAAKTDNLTYEQVCKNLKFYCGWNPKTEDGIKEQITSGLPQLKNVKVKVRGFYVKITFFMPDGIQKKYEYR